jgi:CRP/FNR family cyclic AMP-dependent transcriptional regulator
MAVCISIILDDTGRMSARLVIEAFLSFRLQVQGCTRDIGDVMEDASRRLSPPGFMQLCNGNDIRHFSQEQILFREGDASDGLYLVVSGRLKVFSATGHGRELVYDVVGPGELLGELSLDGGPRSASVKAVTTATCRILNLSQVRTLMRTHSEFADHIISKLIARARHSTRLTRSIALDGVLERVSALLEAHAFGDDAVRRVPSELTQQEIADRIGASREMVHKVLGELVRDGYLQRDEKRRMSIVRPLPRD